AAAKGADALRDHQGIAVSNRHVIHRNAHLLRRDLRKDGLVPLAVGARTGEHRDVSAALHANRSALKTDASARLSESRETDADQLAALARFVSIANEAFVVGQPHRLGKRLFIVTRVVFDVYACPVRELLWANKIFASDFETVHTQIARRFVDQPLDIQHRLRSPRAAIRASGDSIGKD